MNAEDTLHTLILEMQVRTGKDWWSDAKTITAGRWPFKKTSVGYGIFLSSQQIHFYREDGLDPHYVPLEVAVAYMQGVCNSNPVLRGTHETRY